MHATPGPLLPVSQFRLRWNISQTLSYKRRADGRMERQFRHFTAAVDFTKLFNSRNQEVIDVDMPGRWFGVSLRTR